ncbi:MAG: hypothetical protein RLZZ324_1131 [Candidatus Parcubacteria bacterium]
MGKYAKIALVFLYVAQLAVAFHDQLTHVYHDLVDALHYGAVVRLFEGHTPRHEEAPPLGPSLSASFEPRERPMERLFALGAADHSGVLQDSRHEAEPHHHDPNDDDKHKDHRKKRQPRPRLRREYLVIDLFTSLQVALAHPSALAPRSPDSLVLMSVRALA